MLSPKCGVPPPPNRGFRTAVVAEDNGDTVLLDSESRVSFDAVLEALHVGLPASPKAVVVAGCGTSQWMPRLAVELDAAYGIAPSTHNSVAALVLHTPLFVRDWGSSREGVGRGRVGDVSYLLARLVAVFAGSLVSRDSL